MFKESLNGRLYVRTFQSTVHNTDEAGFVFGEHFFFFFLVYLDVFCAIWTEINDRDTGQGNKEESGDFGNFANARTFGGSVHDVDEEFDIILIRGEVDIFEAFLNVGNFENSVYVI